MATQITPYLHLTEAIPGSNEPFSTAVVNANWDAIDSFASTTNTRVTALETWRTTVTPNLNTGLIPSGDATARDAYWGVPATAVDRVALANKAARWFNTTKGYVEHYYAPVSDNATAGYNTALARTVGGWIPEGEGLVPINWTTPRAITGTTANIAISGNTFSIPNTATNVTKIAFDNIFTNDFTNYKLVVNGYGLSVNGFWQSETVRGGTIFNTAGTYSRQALTAIGSTVTSSTTADNKILWNANAASGYSWVAEIFSPMDATRVTQVMSQSWRGDALGMLSTTIGAGADDGLTFFPGGGGYFQGEFKLYGYNAGHI